MHLATLQPAPHHPKLVSTLLLPPTLPSIPIGGSYSPLRGFSGGGVLGPEDLRDLAMCTAMWVAVREGLGALEGVVEQLVGAADPNLTAVPSMADVQHGPPSATTSRAENRKSMESTRTSASVVRPGSGSVPSSAGGSPTDGESNGGSVSKGSRLGPSSVNGGGGNNGKKANGGGGSAASSSGISNAASRVSILFGGGSIGRSAGSGAGGEKGNGAGTSLGLRERWIAATAK